MKSTGWTLARLAVVIGCGMCCACGAQEPPREPAAPATAPALSPVMTPVEELSADREALVRKLEQQLTDAIFVGSWQMADADALDGRGLLSPSRSERYSIQRAMWQKGDTWLIVARMEFGETDVALPLQLEIKWAGDTPIITLDKLPIPGVGTYSARVMIYGNFYCGTWFGDGYGGVMSGQVLRRSEYDRLLSSENKHADATDASSTSAPAGDQDMPPIELKAGADLSRLVGKRVAAIGTLRERDGQRMLHYSPSLSWPVMIPYRGELDGKIVHVVGKVARETVSGSDNGRGRGERFVIEVEKWDEAAAP